MTVVAAVKLSGNPVVIGDVVLSHEGERVGYVSKVYRFGTNVALGWSGPVTRLGLSGVQYLALKSGVENLTQFRQERVGHERLL